MSDDKPTLLGLRFCGCGHETAVHKDDGDGCQRCDCPSPPRELTVGDLKAILAECDDSLVVELDGCDCAAPLGWARMRAECNMLALMRNDH